MGPPPSHEIPRASWYSGYTPDILSFRVQGFNLLWLTFPGHSAKTLYLFECPYPDCSVWALPASLAATGGIEFSFSSSGYLDVSVPRVPFHKLWIHLWMTVVHTAGFPHSEISGSKDICSSPKLIAAYHVFHRLSVPRHPPCALLRLTFVCPFPKKWLPPVPPSVENIRRMS